MPRGRLCRAYSDLSSKGFLKMRRAAVRKLISVQPHEFASHETMFEKLVRMQHFGLPTRLLDVSRNALVALFFATDPGPLVANRLTAW